METVVRTSTGCAIQPCNGKHITAGQCHNQDGPHKAKGLCIHCYRKHNRTYSQRTLPHQHVLMPDDVREIRALYASGEYTQVALAEKFSVSGCTVSLIVRRKTWSDLAD